MRKKTQVVKTQDGHEVMDGDMIWCVLNTITPALDSAILRIGYHDKKYKIYKSRTMAQRELDKWKIQPK